MRRVIAIDIHRTFAEVMIWETDRHEGRIDMTRTALEGFAGQLKKANEVVNEATGNCRAASGKATVMALPLHMPRHLPISCTCAARLSRHVAVLPTLISEGRKDN
ncbi:hypothetical protein [Roseovarius sp. M141]|uniref:hypothetical protein n=1 Tax=Roseovarius sp. M141 TaxID=2583806 RepID=UPI0020CBCF5D|nr:hypothetical protein [Roseovarius sp. M141]